MAPDLNSLPASASPTAAAFDASPRTQSPTLHHAASHLQHQRSSPRQPPNLQRRASSRLGSFSLTDDAPSSPVTANPYHHHRQPSLGELHQELEEEQEAQVNRLLALIRSQQATIAAYEASSAHPSTSTQPSPAVSQSHSRSQSQSQPHAAPTQSGSTGALSSAALQRQPSTSLSRASSRRSQASSPSLPERGRHASRATEPVPLNAAERDHVAHIQAEALAVARENESLKLRIRELERLVGERREAG